MATVVSKTSIKIDDLINDTVVSGSIDATSGHLILVTRGGASIDAGLVTKPFGASWSSTATYENGDVVGYAGMMWKAKSAVSANKPPALFTSLWTRLAGEDTNDWSEKDSFFDGDDPTESWQFFWKTGSPVISLTTVAGEFESGFQALKISCASGETQRFYQKEENITRGGETITATVRARLLSASTGAKLQGIIMQNDGTGLPEPFATGSTSVAATEGDQVMTTAWATYTFTFTTAAGKPRTSIQFNVATVAAGAIFLIDRVKITRSKQPSQKAPDVQIFTGNGTWTKPIGAKTVVVEAVGGGGGGGGCGATGAGQAAAAAGGGAGSPSKSTLSASALGATETVTVGAAGTAGPASATAGGNGGDSSFGTWLVAKGGSGGAGATANAGFIVANGGAGGVAGTGDIAGTGARGRPGWWSGSNGFRLSGAGAASPFGGGGGEVASGAGAAGTGNGSGGSGGASGASAAAVGGGAGTAGIVIVTTYFE